jgi:transcription initiation factor TFIIIB Brf1 subunit/transcription initiation factor TFIIB
MSQTTTTDIETGEVICTKCGQVISDKIVESVGVYTYARDGRIADKRRIISSGRIETRQLFSLALCSKEYSHW